MDRERAGHGTPVQYAVAGTIRQGDALGSGADLWALLPEDLVGDDDVLYRVDEHLPTLHLRASDVLVVERRADGQAATGEFVVARVGAQIFVGRWWAKHGRRAVMDGDMAVIREDDALTVVGAVTTVVRTEPWSGTHW